MRAIVVAATIGQLFVYATAGLRGWVFARLAPEPRLRSVAVAITVASWAAAIQASVLLGLLVSAGRPSVAELVTTGGETVAAVGATLLGAGALGLLQSAPSSHHREACTPVPLRRSARSATSSRP